MKPLRFLLALAATVLFAAPAAADKDHLIYGGIFTTFTNQRIDYVKAYLYTPDSVLVDSMVTNPNIQNNDRWGAYYFYVEADFKGGIVRLEKEGYEPTSFRLAPHRFRKRELGFFTGDAHMDLRREQKLGEAVVQATKIKFYARGDTLVYNADAFQLAEGSMLDALIKQLPGVELKEGGVITVNGKQVESLLLNGEDFFRGNHKIMLENLPAYTVENVEVYDKYGIRSQMTGLKLGDEHYVMDVKLKREYSIGWMGNFEGGYGTRQRYLAHLFAMRFTPQSRVTAYANINNLNDNRKPGETSEWTPEKMPSGLLATKMGGLDYLIKDRRQRFKINGSATFSHSDVDNYTRSAQENFLPEGNNWTRSENASKAHNISLSTNHQWEFKPNQGLTIHVSPNFSYSKQRFQASSASATFSADPDIADPAALFDSIRQPDAGPWMRRLAVNRYLTEQKNNSESYSGNLGFNIIKKAIFNDLLGLSGNVSYSDSHADNFNHYQLDFPSAGTDAGTDFRNRWNPDRPNRNFSYHIAPSYLLTIKGNLYMDFSYRLSQTYREHDNALYRLDEIDGWGQGTQQPVGALPSEAQAVMETMDEWNSYQLDQTTTRHNFTVSIVDYHYYGESFSPALYYNVSIPLTVEHERLDYKRGDFDGVRSRTSVLPGLNSYVQYMWDKESRHTVRLDYNISTQTPGMTDLIDIEDNSDPLNIYHGNPALKNTQRHFVSLSYRRVNTGKGRTFSADASYNITRNARAWAYVYDRATGVRTYRPDNVNGNYLLIGNVNYSFPLDRKKQLTLSTFTRYQFYHNVDLISVDNAVAPSRSTVRTHWLTETLKLDYRLGSNLQVGVKGYASWNQALSDRADFQTVNVWEYNYGPTVSWKLPLDFELSTDLVMYSRRGYEDASANTNDLVWNARLAKRFLKGNFALIVDGFDILGQLSNVWQSINSQGRTETYRNVIPRYVMLHAIYRFTTPVKKR